MISKEQARVLKHLSKSWCYQREMLKEATVLELAELLGENYAQIRHFTGDGSNKIVITDTGRLALEEYENFQEQGRLLAEWSHAEANENAPVVSDAAKIAALEAENAALRGLLGKVLNGLEPFAGSTKDTDVIDQDDDEMLLIMRYDATEKYAIGINTGKNVTTVLRVEHLRAAATIAADIRAALDPTTPYENTPDGSDLLARDTEADDDE